jgi:hypothetical protein
MRVPDILESRPGYRFAHPGYARYDVQLHIGE